VTGRRCGSISYAARLARHQNLLARRVRIDIFGCRHYLYLGG
jgi:hypothetical protein